MNTKSELAAAAVIGSIHRRVDRPCQDAVATARTDAVSVVVVADGCGSGQHSELGARLGARLLAAAIAAHVDAGAAVTDAATWDAASDDVLAHLRALVAAFGGDPRQVVIDHFLFTLVAAAVTADGAAAWVLGDGVIAIDGDVRVLDAGDDNAPPYLAYRLVDGPAATGALFVAPPCARSIVVATDGAAALVAHAGRALPGGRGAVLDLARVAADDRMFRNPDALRRRLAVASADIVVHDDRHPALLTDDTAVAVVRWAVEAAC
jgi:hypothetical protein